MITFSRNTKMIDASRLARKLGCRLVRIDINGEIRIGVVRDETVTKSTHRLISNNRCVVA